MTSLTIGTDEMLHPEDSKDGSGKILPSGKGGNLSGSMVSNGGGLGTESAAAAAARFTTGVPPIDRIPAPKVADRVRCRRRERGTMAQRRMRYGIRKNTYKGIFNMLYRVFHVRCLLKNRHISAP